MADRLSLAWNNHDSVPMTVLVMTATIAHAALMLTPAGIADGFTLTTFATLNPGNTGFGPFGVAVASNGNILVSNDFDSTRYVFAEWTDKQKPHR